jgi:hypothetical protein
MDAYTELRCKAAQKRDKIIQRARADYHDLIREIDKLRSRLDPNAPAVKPKAKRTMIELVCDLMPRDKAFTFADIRQVLSEAEPGRKFNEMSIRTILPKLEAQGIIRRVSKNQSGRVEWAVAGITIPESPYGAMALTDIAEQVLRERGPMTPVELVVMLQEQGYRADADPRRMVAALKNSVRRYPGRFVVKTDGRWAAA